MGVSGAIRVDTSEVIKGLDLCKKGAEKAIKRSISDFRSRGPGWVSKAVREHYNIKGKDVKESVRAKKQGLTGVGGILVDDIVLEYSGRVLTPTHFGMKPKTRPKKKGYSVTAEIKKGQRKSLGKNVFLGKSGKAGTIHIPWKRTTPKSHPIEAIKTLSVPQMIVDGNENPKPGIVEAVEGNLRKRFEHHLSRL